MTVYTVTITVRDKPDGTCTVMTSIMPPPPVGKPHQSAAIATAVLMQDHLRKSMPKGATRARKTK